MVAKFILLLIIFFLHQAQPVIESGTLQVSQTSSNYAHITWKNIDSVHSNDGWTVTVS